jgi:hypothetical protein
MPGEKHGGIYMKRGCYLISASDTRKIKLCEELPGKKRYFDCCDFKNPVISKI